MEITRLAPSPTGALHLGNARTFLVNWVLARQRGWRIVLRVEDLDGPRVKAGADQVAIDDLRWLGMDWDEGPIYQSPRAAHYGEAIRTLQSKGMAYPCVCTRKEIDAAASAPHLDDGASIYPGTCRGRYGSIEQATAIAGRAPAMRFAVPDQTVEFEDLFAGRRMYDARAALGDFVIAKSDRTAAYQLAVVVDDAAMGITQVVRGDDLLDSTPRQILLFEALGLGDRIPQFHHLPLVVGADGLRLAKRHGDTRLSFYRERGVPAERILALLARWMGLFPPKPGACTIEDLVRSFRLENLPRERIVFAAADDAWLRS